MPMMKEYTQTEFGKRFTPYLREIQALEIPYGVMMLEYLKPVTDAPEEQQEALQAELLAKARAEYPLKAISEPGETPAQASVTTEAPAEPAK